MAIWTANKKMILASSWENDNSVDFLIISEDFNIFHGNFKFNTLRGLLQDHGQGNNAGGRRRRLQFWFKFSLFGNLCLRCKYAIIGEGRSNVLKFILNKHTVKRVYGCTSEWANGFQYTWRKILKRRPPQFSLQRTLHFWGWTIHYNFGVDCKLTFTNHLPSSSWGYVLLEVEIKCQHECLHFPFAKTKLSRDEWKTGVMRNIRVANWGSGFFGRMVN